MSGSVDKPSARMKSTYDPQSHAKLQEQQSNSQFMQRKLAISKIEDKLISTRQMKLQVTDLMDLIEETIHSCGGESKVMFLEVTSDMIRIQTRVPMQANLYPFLPEAHLENMRFHKKVINLLMLANAVHGIRWHPAQEGAIMVVSLK